ESGKRSVSSVPSMKSSFFIVADRGNLKAYRAEKMLAGRPPRVKLVQAFALTEAHLRTSEIVTDQAGAFPTGNGGYQNSISDRHFDIETNRRLTKQLGAHINTVLQRSEPDGWSFAAPAEIHDAVLDHVPENWRHKLAEQIQADL